MSGKENISPPGRSGGSGFNCGGAVTVVTRQYQPVGIFGPLLEKAESLYKPDMIFDRMINAGNAEYIGPAETERLNQQNAFFVSGPGIKGRMINTVEYYLYPVFDHSRLFYKFLFYPFAYRDNPVQPAQRIGEDHP
jgi:hypothetical protein